MELFFGIIAAALAYRRVNADLDTGRRAGGNEGLPQKFTAGDSILSNSLRCLLLL